MTGLCIDKLPHSCGSSDALQVFDADGQITGYCFACETYEPKPYGDKPTPTRVKKVRKTDEEIRRELTKISNYPSCSLADRLLDSDSISYFNIKVGLSERDGLTPKFHFYPYYSGNELVSYKARLVENKKIWWINRQDSVELFGWNQALATGAKRLYITEGELDAVALYQALKKKNKNTQWSEFNPAIVSLIDGAGSAKQCLTKFQSDIRANFQEVVLVFDEDESGQLAREQALQVYPTARTVKLPSKDPNECILEGKSMALCNAVLFKTSVPKNTRLVNASSLYEAARIPAKWGLSWPWAGLTALTRGIRYGETYYIGAGVKMGKSEIVNTLAAHFITEHNVPVFLAKPEEANKKTVKMVLGKVAGKIFYDPTIEFDGAAYDEAAKLVGNKLCMLSLYQHLGWESLRSDILVAVEQGCKAVFIDPITNLVNGIDSGQTNTVLQEIAQELAALAKDLDIVIFIFCHLKAPLSGASHERGGKIHSSQFSGSRAMMRSCNLMLGLEGDKNPELSIEERNTRKLIILEDREFGATGIINLFWDYRTGLFTEIKEENPYDGNPRREKADEK